MTRGSDPYPDIEAFEERAAIIEYGGGVNRQTGRRPRGPGAGVPGPGSLLAGLGRLRSGADVLTLPGHKG